MSLPRLDLKDLGHDPELDLLAKIMQFAEPVVTSRLAPGLVYVVDEVDGPSLLWDDTVHLTRTFLGGFAEDVLEAEDDGLFCLPCDLLYATESLGSPRLAKVFAQEIVILPEGVEFYPFPVDFTPEEWTLAEEMCANYAIEDREAIETLADEIADMMRGPSDEETDSQAG